MINHARTLLINQSGPRLHDSGNRLDVYIPPFAAQDLPAPLKNVWRQLFGAAPSYAAIIENAARYMQILSIEPALPYVLALDPRLTYDSNADIDDLIAMQTPPHLSSEFMARFDTAGMRRHTADFDTFYRMTDSRKPLALRIAGVLLNFIYEAEHVRNKTGS